MSRNGSCSEPGRTRPPWSGPRRPRLTSWIRPATCTPRRLTASTRPACCCAGPWPRRSVVPQRGSRGGQGRAGRVGRMTGRFLKACLNGPREPSEHPALPVTPAAIAADAAAAVAAGADALHIHPKDPAGHDTLEPDVVAAVLEAVRAAVPGVPVGLTTAAPAAPEPAERIELVRGWTVRPDFASVNWHEPGSPELAETLLGIGVGVEPGLWQPEAVSAWRGWPHRGRCVRLLLEITEDLPPDEAVGAARRLVASLG